MLVLTRQVDEAIMIGDTVEITIVEVRGSKVRLGVRAPSGVSVHRKEVFLAIRQENLEASQVGPEVLERVAAAFPGRPPAPRAGNHGTGSTPDVTPQGAPRPGTG